MSENLKYFTSIPIDDHKEAFKELENVLQQQHKSDGTHPIASESQAGFLSPQDYQRLKQIFIWFENNMR